MQLKIIGSYAEDYISIYEYSFLWHFLSSLEHLPRLNE